MAAPHRRNVLKVGVVLALFAMLVLRPWAWQGEGELAFEDMPDLAPFRRLASDGALSSPASFDPLLIGIADPAPESGVAEATARLRPTLCSALLGAWPGSGAVPIHYFGDLYCPNCPGVERSLAAIAETDGHGVRITSREFPVFGPASEMAARAILAANQQDAGDAMRSRLRRSTPATSPEALADLALGIGLDGPRFIRDLSSEAVDAHLDESRALGRILGIPGTPSLVIGRTIVVGARSGEVLQRLVALEADLGPPSCP